MAPDSSIRIAIIAMIASVPVIATLAVVWMFASLRRKQEALRDALAQFAKRVQGQFVTEYRYFTSAGPGEVRFLHGKTPCLLLVDVEHTGERNSEYPGRTYYVRLLFDLGRPAQFTCRIVPQGLPTLLAGMLRTADVRVGRDEFDRQFIVEASDELRAPDVLSRPIQEQLLALREAALAMAPLHSGHVTLKVQDRWIEVRMKGFFDDSEQLWPFYQLGGRLFDLLGPRV
jgi:hypothetical protein